MPPAKKPSSARSISAKASPGRRASVSTGAKVSSVAEKPLRPAAMKEGTKPVKSKSTSAALKAPAGSALNVSIKVGPLVDIVRQHVHNLSPAAARAIKHDFAKAFQLATPAAGERTDKTKRAAAADAVDPVLSSQQAADLVGVSRPYMVARIDAGDVALHQQVGNQRRVLKSSVLAWQKNEQARRRRALAQLGASLDDEIFPG